MLQYSDVGSHFTSFFLFFSYFFFRFSTYDFDIVDELKGRTDVTFSVFALFSQPEEIFGVAGGGGWGVGGGGE